jgi:hypothetical protein
MKSILDPTFRYTNAASTDLRKTFAKHRRLIAAQRVAAKSAQSADTDKVLRIFAEREKKA